MITHSLNFWCLLLLDHFTIASVVDGAKLTQEQFNAISGEVEILKPTIKPKTQSTSKPRIPHAEMQLLGKIIANVEDGTIKENSEIYIGISKLCCLHCNTTLNAAADILKDKVTLNFRGAHNLEFDKNWEPPLILSEGTSKIGKNIWDIAKKSINKQLKETLNPSGITQRPVVSDSDRDSSEAGSEKGEDKEHHNRLLELKNHQSFFEKQREHAGIKVDIVSVRERISAAVTACQVLNSSGALSPSEQIVQSQTLMILKNRLELLNTLSFENQKSIEEVLSLISIAINLHGLETFQLYSSGISIKNLKNVLRTIKDEYYERYASEITIDDLRTILGNSILAGDISSNFVTIQQPSGLAPPHSNDSSSPSPSSSLVSSMSISLPNPSHSQYPALHRPGGGVFSSASPVLPRPGEKKGSSKTADKTPSSSQTTSSFKPKQKK